MGQWEVGVRQPENIGEQVYVVVLTEKASMIDFRLDITYTIIEFNKSTTSKVERKEVLL